MSVSVCVCWSEGMEECRPVTLLCIGAASLGGRQLKAQYTCQKFVIYGENKTEGE